jgi:hypothetical protein
LGWTAGRNVQIDIRLSGQASETRKHVAELVELAPDVILASARRNRLSEPVWRRLFASPRTSPSQAIGANRLTSQVGWCFRRLRHRVRKDGLPILRLLSGAKQT